MRGFDNIFIDSISLQLVFVCHNSAVRGNGSAVEYKMKAQEISRLHRDIKLHAYRLIKLINFYLKREKNVSATKKLGIPRVGLFNQLCKLFQGLYIK